MYVSLLIQVPYCYYYARDVWAAASMAVNRVCCYLASYHCTGSNESRNLHADATPQWEYEGELPRIHTKVGGCAIEPDNGTSVNGRRAVAICICGQLICVMYTLS